MIDEPGETASDRLPAVAGSAGRARRGRRRSDRAREQLEQLEGGENAIVQYFKERVYATFTGLAIVLVVASSAHAEADHAFFALVLGVLGITAAGLVSDVISHLAVHRTFPGGRDLAISLRIAGGALGTLLTPGILLLLAWLEVMPLDASLQAASIVYIATLAVIGWFAVRRSDLAWYKQLLALALLVALGLLVIGLQTLAHSI
ncbi:hypothetical protein [Microbacterium allomyrinae]|jgi:energy-converting hydrogenase Eha subunit H|uniref:VIT family protein n=1 Tax=Microbacterium allomyrinae TaxID=2830666 RepID=A0A9X1S412_9MICO|nr:hypothetical protein [Microbacterium allomyrinae]MCC2032563.1 hypothetical protein [Microbacterium allomyrinae]